MYGLCMGFGVHTALINLPAVLKMGSNCVGCTGHKARLETILFSHHHCSCGHAFSIAHALLCPTGGYPSIRHNKVRDITASLLTEVCHDVSIEPHLQPITGESMAHRTANTDDQSILDIAASGFWGGGGGGRFERAFFDVRVFNPSSQSNQQASLSSTYRRHEMEKKRSY